MQPNETIIDSLRVLGMSPRSESFGELFESSRKLNR